MILCKRCNRYIQSRAYLAHRERCRFPWGWILFWLTLLLAGAALEADEVYEEGDWVKGGVASRTNSGQCYYKPFVKVGITNDDPDTGEPQIIGYTPGNVQVSRKGDVIWERVHEKRFARRGIPARGCSERCPNYNL